MDDKNKSNDNIDQNWEDEDSEAEDTEDEDSEESNGNESEDEKIGDNSNYIDRVENMSEEEKKIVDESRKNYCFV